MRGPKSLTGVVATIRWSYFDAADIRGYAIAYDRDTQVTTVAGTIVVADAFKLSRPDLLFVAKLGRGSLVYRILDPVPRQCGPFHVRLSNDPDYGLAPR